jgi:LuxR family transcriptional regulator, maltose regulon positive regulatory protein
MAPAPQLLATKLYLPRARPDLVSRPRLFARLDAGLHGALTLICAPAGFGKTTLLAEWLRSTGRPVAWIGLDARDNDPTTFVRYLVAALQKLEPAVGAALPGLLQSPASPPLDVLLTILINDLTLLPGSCVLVLDDYHTLPSPAIQQAVGFLIDHLPPMLHLVIATREDPSLPLARLRARRHVAELRAEHLRFTADEVAVFLTEVMGLGLTPSDVLALETRTEGWIAGLQLAALAMQDNNDYTGFITAFTGSNRFIVDYLVDEVLSRQPPHIQSFLLHTSILDRMCGPLCDMVLESEMAQSATSSTRHAQPEQRAQSQALLEQLERANLFVSPLDAERYWYRYHHLFAEVLAERLRRETPAETRAILHRRASLWYAQHDWIPEAIEHALAAESPDGAAALIETHGQRLMARGELIALTRWLRLLPDDTLRARPSLLILLAWLLPNTGALADVARYRAEAEALLAAAPDPALKSELLALQLQPLIFQDRTAEVIVIGTQVLEHLPVEHFFHSGSGVITGLAHLRQSQLEQAERILSAAVVEARTRQSLFFVVSGLTRLAMVAAERGDFAQAERHYADALAACRGPSGKLSPIAGMALVGLGNLRAWQGQADDAMRTLEQSLELCGQLIAAPFFFLDGYTGLADLLAARGRFAEAFHQLALAEDRVRRFDNPVFMDTIAAHRASMWRAQGSPSFQTWLDTHQQRLEDPLTFVREKEYETLIHGLIDTNQAAAALSAVDRLEDFARRTGRIRSEVDLLVLRAMAAQQQGKLPIASTALARALALAAPMGYTRVFIESGAPVVALLEAHSAQRKAQSDPLQRFCERLLAAIERSDGAQADTTNVVLRPNAPMRQPLAEPLTAREIEVLGLIAAGASNGAIAQRLIVSVGTVKKHTANIFGKLQVESRTQAVARARELGLL